MTGVRAVVSVPWLAKQIQNASKNLQLLDTTWSVNKSSRPQYLNKHIPCAVFHDLNKCIQPRPTCARTLPEPGCYGNYLQSLGINQENHLVVYDDGGIVSAARAWWTLRAYGHSNVSVLNGGLREWERQGHETEEDEEEVEKGNFEVTLRPDLICHFSDMQQWAHSRTHQILDVRNPKHFIGLEEEPTQSTVTALEAMGQPVPSSMLKGHVKGSKNFKLAALIDPDTGLLLEPDLIKKVFESHGVDVGKPVTTICYNGNMASLLALAAHEIGINDASVYYGSWTEFGQLGKQKDVETTESRSSG